MAGFVARFVSLPSDAALTAVTLWAAHAHAVAEFDSTPRLAFLSPEPHSGKTRALEVLETLCPNPLRTSSVSTPVLFRLIGSDHPPTVFLDEVDAIWTARGQAEDLRALVNAGHRKGSDAYRMVGEGAKMTARRFAQYAAMCLAGLGTLPGTVADRSVIVHMRRRLTSEPVQPWRIRTAEPAGHDLRDRLAGWLADEAVDLATRRPVMPPAVTDRAADCWEPLLAVAEAAGGDWPVRARAACLELATAEPGAASAGLRLLADVRTVWPYRVEFAPTSSLVTGLIRLEDAPWSLEPVLTARRLAALLSHYGVRPRSTGTERGYDRDAFLDPWARYCPSLSGDTS